jgi:hypothetical protein
MRPSLACFALAILAWPAVSQNAAEGPADEKAKKTYERALQEVKEHRTDFALDDFKKADKQDGGHCKICERQMVKYGMELGEWKTAELAATEIEKISQFSFQAIRHLGRISRPAGFSIGFVAALS